MAAECECGCTESPRDPVQGLVGDRSGLRPGAVASRGGAGAHDHRLTDALHRLLRAAAFGLAPFRMGHIAPLSDDNSESSQAGDRDCRDIGSPYAIRRLG